MTMASRALRMMGKVPTLTFPKQTLQQLKKRRIYSKPPQDQIGAVQSFFVMSMFAIAMLTPAAWILRHLPEYRSRAQQSPRS